MKNESYKSEKELLTEKLDKLLFETAGGLVISIKGSWGIGKSYFWDHFIREYLKPKIRLKQTGKKPKYAYISLFGIDTLNDIRNNIILQISKFTKVVSSFQDKIEGSKISGINISSPFNLLKRKKFKNIIVCFDDLERLSAKLDLKDILGLIAELKEQNSCKVILINNFDQLEDVDILNNRKILKMVKETSNGRPKNYTELLERHEEELIPVEKYQLTTSNNQGIVSKFLEKIVDYDLIFNPSIEENFSLFENRIEYFDKKLILGMLEDIVSEDKDKKSVSS